MKRKVASALIFTLLSTYSSLAEDSDGYVYSRSELFSIIRNAQPGIDLFSLPSKFKFPDNARASSVFGLDYSHYQASNCK
jgi:hypothetical protein